MDEIIKLKNELEVLKKNQSFNRLSAIGSILTPLVVALIGGYFAFFGKSKEIDFKTQEVQYANEIAEKDRWIEHAKFARELMGDFLEEDQAKAKMALQIISHADANLGSKLSSIVAESSQSTIKEFANDNKTKLRDVMIRQLVHPEKSVRWNAAEGLLSHSADPLLIPNLLNFAYEEPNAPNIPGGENWRIYNVMAVLVDLARGNASIVEPEKEKILKFAEWAKKQDNRTVNLGEELLKGLK